MSRILDAIDRLQREMGVDYDRLMDSIPPVVAHSLLARDPKLNEIILNGADLPTFEVRFQRVQTMKGLTELLDGLDEPGVDELSIILTFLRSLPSKFKALLQKADARIRPLGGPPELLSDPVEVSAMVDEIFEVCKRTGATEGSVQAEIARKKGISLKTVQRRFREELERRRSIAEWSARQDDNKKSLG